MHILAAYNPRWLRQVEHQRHWSVNVWCGIVRDFVIGPYFIEGTLIGDKYACFLSDVLPSFLEDVHLPSKVYTSIQRVTGSDREATPEPLPQLTGESSLTASSFTSRGVILSLSFRRKTTDSLQLSAQTTVRYSKLEMKVNAAPGAESAAPRRNRRPTSPSPLPGMMRSRPPVLRFWEYRKCRQRRRDLLASQTSSRLLEFLIRLATTQACSGETVWCLSPPRRITRVGGDSRSPGRVYESEVKRGRRLENAGRRRVRCSWLEWTRGHETDEGVGGRNGKEPLLGTHPSIHLERSRKIIENRNQNGWTRDRTLVLTRFPQKNTRIRCSISTSGGKPAAVTSPDNTFNLVVKPRLRPEAALRSPQSFEHKPSAGSDALLPLIITPSWRDMSTGADVPDHGLEHGDCEQVAGDPQYIKPALSNACLYVIRGHGGRTVSLLASHHGEPSSIPGRATPEPRMWESCRTMPLVGRPSRESPVPPTLPLRRHSILTSTTHVGSQDLAMSWRLNYKLKHLPVHCHHGNTRRLFANGNRAGRCRWSAGFSRASPVSPAPSFWSCSMFTSVTLFGSQDLAVKSNLNLLTHLGALSYILGLADTEGWPSADDHNSAHAKPSANGNELQHTYTGGRREEWSGGYGSGESVFMGHQRREADTRRQGSDLWLFRSEFFRRSIDRDPAAAETKRAAELWRGEGACDGLPTGELCLTAWKGSREDQVGRCCLRHGHGRSGGELAVVSRVTRKPGKPLQLSSLQVAISTGPMLAVAYFLLAAHFRRHYPSGSSSITQVHSSIQTPNSHKLCYSEARRD
ncbi:hypothetical protein PR048_019723 [Dryococelus australis]|uniref:Uncharacterized protein n=1 Tax=Dryococelus australis TaxID=614101 RepID=A0ABQ9H4D3_9NEOP|nr:hypothetical protein PR048_019723 [Dryococelus australis]